MGANAREADDVLPVVIIGGGPVGLVSSILLSMQGIEHRVFEQFPGTSIHPKAVGLNQRTVELFRSIGIEDEFKKHRAPLDMISKTGWFTGIGPNDHPILVRDAWGGGVYAEAYKTFSPVDYSCLPQIRLEPILQQRALQLNPDAVRYNSKVTGVVEKDDHVLVTVKDTKDAEGAAREFKARYVLAADGGRGMAEQLGIGWEGESDITDMISVHFRSKDLRKYHPEPKALIAWLINPRMRGSLGTGYVYHLGPYDRYNATGDLNDLGTEFLLAAPKLSDDPQQFDQQTTTARVRKSLGIPDLDMELLSNSLWTVNARVTERYRSAQGRVFLVGDACHRVPPWGALGMNSGLGDAYNLIWKLTLALQASDPHMYDALLDTYETERKPIAVRVAKNSLANMRNHAGMMDKALGIDPDAEPEKNVKAMDAYFDPTHPEYKTKRQAAADASTGTDHEFNAPGIEIGWFYPSVDIEGQGKATRHDGQLLADGSFNFTEYCPSTIPGHHLPHAWLQRGGERASTRDLVRSNKFVLITGDAAKWEHLNGELLDLEVIEDNSTSVSWTPVDDTWGTLRGCEKDGAMLVRPDGIVAWRARTWTAEIGKNFPAIFNEVVLKR